MTKPKLCRMLPPNRNCPTVTTDAYAIIIWVCSMGMGYHVISVW